MAQRLTGNLSVNLVGSNQQPPLEMPSKHMPLALRLAGCWLLWSAWCALTGWGLSTVNQLSGRGHLALLPVLLAAVWLWLKATASTRNDFPNFAKWRRRLTRPLPFLYFTIAGLSLLAGMLNANPWSIDAATYRLPRMLYWWSAHHWYWIGTLDHRLDFSSTGFEWQMLPVIELTHSLRLIFLLNWIPFLLLPWLVFLAFRAFGVRGRSARRWMWLLPSGHCFALQCKGLQPPFNAAAWRALIAAVLPFAVFELAAAHHRTPGSSMFLRSAGIFVLAKNRRLDGRPDGSVERQNSRCWRGRGGQPGFAGHECHPAAAVSR